MITAFTIWVLLSVTTARQYEMEYYTTRKACIASAKVFNEDRWFVPEIVYVCEERKVYK